MLFRKKPVVIEAIQFTGSNLEEIKKFAGKFVEDGGDELVISTIEGPLVASPKDWIIKGIVGEFYPCKPHVFEATYEWVE